MEKSFEFALEWTLEPCDKLTLREYIGDLTISEGRVWQIMRSGAVIMLETDIPHPDNAERNCVYCSAPMQTIPTLAAKLLAETEQS